MLRISTTCLTVLLLFPFLAQAQASDPPKWDFAATTGLYEHQPGPRDAQGYGDYWFATWKSGATLGRYWAPHFKTEIELATTGEGRRWSQRFVFVPGTTGPVPYGVDEYFRFTQGSVRAVWQFFDNQWIHPYLLAGVAVDVERRREVTHDPYLYTGDGRLPGGRVQVPQQDASPATTFNPGIEVGGGAKLYFTSNVFANTTLVIKRAKPATSVSWVGGLGVDF